MTATPRSTSAQPLRWDGERLHILDQTRLPAKEAVLTLWGAADTADAIRRPALPGAGGRGGPGGRDPPAGRARRAADRRGRRLRDGDGRGPRARRAGARR